MRAALYIRVSTQEQANEGYSVGAQTERLKAYCTARDWSIAGIYTDPGFSGAKMERPAIKQLISDTQTGKVDIVVVYKLDRLSRSQKDTLYLIEDVFLSNDVAFVSVNENFDTSTAFGRAMVGILSVFAQLEREQIRERTMMGLAERAKDGYWRGGGNTPIGYTYNEQTGVLDIDDYEALQVRKIFELYVNEHLSSNMISAVMSKSYTNKYGNWNCRSNIIRVLSNQTYVGKVPHKGIYYDGRHEPIIDQHVFDQAQSMLKLRAVERKPTDPHHSPFKATQLLTGLLWCGNCGARFYAVGSYRGSKKLPYSQRTLIHHYMCYSRAKTRKEMIKDPDCTNEKWSVADLDSRISHELLQLQYSAPRIQKIIDSQCAKRPSGNSEITRRRIEIVTQQIGKLLDLYQLQNVPFEQITDRLQKLTDEKEHLTATLSQESEPSHILTYESAVVLLRHADCILSSGSLQDQRFLVHTFINRIILTDDHISIEWNL